jgi:hypothetical protein
LWYYFLNCVYPNPPCQLSLWEETGAPGENPRLSAERWLTLYTRVRTENRTHELRGEKALALTTATLKPLYYSFFGLSSFILQFIILPCIHDDLVCPFSRLPVRPTEEQLAVMRKARMKERKMFFLIQEIIVHLIFMIVIALVTYGHKDSRSVHMFRHIDELSKKTDKVRP